MIASRLPHEPRSSGYAGRHKFHLYPCPKSRSHLCHRCGLGLGWLIISHTCALMRQLKLNSYERLFPNQDTMPKGGFGNLIA